MTSETLSQLDIDRLLGGRAKLTPHATASVDVQVYDWRRPHRVSKERLRTLEAMYERLVKNLEAWLISRVRGQMEIRLQSVEQFAFGEFTLSLPTPCSSFVFVFGRTDRGLTTSSRFPTTYYSLSAARAPRALNAALTRSSSCRSLIAYRLHGAAPEILQIRPMELGITGFESSP